MSSETSRRVAACGEALREFLERETGALLAAAREPLIVAARDAKDRDEEDRLLSVLEEVEALAPQATDAFRGAMLARLTGPDAHVGNGDVPSADDGLSLVETAKVDDWLRLRAILARQTEGARVFEVRIWERLAAHLGVEPHPDDSPISLQAICVQFQAAMQNLAPGRGARAAIYDAFETTVVARLNHLAARLEVLLDEDVDALPAAVPEQEEGGALVQGSQETDAGAEEVDSGQTGLDPARMLGAMAGVQRRELQEPAAGLDDLEERLLEAIAPRLDVELDASERRTVAAVARLVRQVVEDPEVDPAVQRRLAHLAPPLLMLALQDDAYLEAEIHAARHDPVTGLLDRAAFRARLEAASRRRRADAVCLVDVDEFGQVTARLGHQAGGRLLRALADLLRKQAGRRGIVARLRGDEFAVLLPLAKEGAGRRFADRYLGSLAGARFVFGGEEVALHASIGVVEASAGLTTPAELMRAADAARNAAKLAGGGCVRVHAPAG